MHHHSHHVAEVSWPLFALLMTCSMVSAGRLLSRPAERATDVVHLLMNLAMAAMVLDAGMSLGTVWLGVTGALAAALGGRLFFDREPVAFVHVGAALVMVAATQSMLSGSNVLTTVLAVVTAVDVVGTAVVLVAQRRTVVVPHLGMGIGMLAMLVGA